MGILRLFLALCVVIAHCGTLFKLTFVGGMIAVQTFYMISGFYMSLILTKKYVGEGSYKLFISNRILRLYPIYFFVLILSVIGYLLSAKFFGNGFSYDFFTENFHKLNIGSSLTVIFSSLFLLGQDLFCFFGLDNISGNFIFVSNFLNESFKPYEFMFVPQAWTLSLEFMFYLAAPFLVKQKSRYIIAIVLLSLFARIFAYSQGFYHDPWTYRFFPFESAFFLTGILIYRLYEKYKNISIPDKISYSVLGFVVLYSVLYQYIPVTPEIKQWGYYSVMIFALPLLFKLTKNTNWDKFIGELSYPVYISHLLILNIASLAFAGSDMPKYFPVIVIVTTIIFSIFLIRYISEPVEKYRQSRIKNKDIKTEISVESDEKQPAAIN